MDPCHETYLAPTLSEEREKQVLFMNKNLFRKTTTKQQQRKHLGFD